MEYICIKTFTLHDITFQKGNVYIIKTPLSPTLKFLEGKYRDIYDIENKWAMTTRFSMIEENLIPLSEWRETQIESILK